MARMVSGETWTLSPAIRLAGLAVVGRDAAQEEVGRRLGIARAAERLVEEERRRLVAARLAEFGRRWEVVERLGRGAGDAVLREDAEVVGGDRRAVARRRG